jgi:hypothetical protein
MAHTALVVRDNIDSALAGLSPVRGTPAKIDNDGKWTRGYEKDVLNVDQDFLLVDTSEVWRLLRKGHPIEYVPREPGSPTRPPRPDSFEEEESWPTFNGTPSDPWKYCCVVHLIALANGETFNFVAATAGGWVARDELLEQIKSMRMMKPGALPIVRLASTSFKTKFGLRKRPMFRIVGWQQPKTEAAMLIEAHKSKANTELATERVHPFNDELPY